MTCLHAERDHEPHDDGAVDRDDADDRLGVVLGLGHGGDLLYHGSHGFTQSS